MENAFKGPRSLLATTGLLLGAIAYHLWRVATLRADFPRLADAASGAVVFGGLALFAATARWHLRNDMSVGRSLLIGISTLLFYVILFERPGRSSSLVFAAYMASAVVDLCMTALWALGAVDHGPADRRVASAVELGLVAAAAWRFFRAPADVRARGYRRSSGPQD